MKERNVVFSPEASQDLLSLYDWITNAAGHQTAINYLERLERYCNGFSLAAERGTLRSDIRANLRVVGFERNITIAFSVDDNDVTILRLFYRGKDWESELS